MAYPLGQDSLAIVKGLDNNDSLSVNSVLRAVTGDSERHVVNVGGSGKESLGSISGLILEASEDSNSFTLNKGLDSLGIGQGSGRRPSLLLYPADDGLGSSAASVLHGLAVLEELQGGVSSDLELLSQLGLLSGVDLAELDSRVLLSQQTGGLSILGGKGWKIKRLFLCHKNKLIFIVIATCDKCSCPLRNQVSIKKMWSQADQVTRETRNRDTGRQGRHKALCQASQRVCRLGACRHTQAQVS